jgi:hypothetical protein
MLSSAMVASQSSMRNEIVDGVFEMRRLANLIPVRLP